MRSLFLKQKVESVDRLAGSWPVVYMMPGLQYCGMEFSRLRVAAWHCPIDLNTHVPEAAEKTSTNCSRQTKLKVSQGQAKKCERWGSLGTSVGSVLTSKLWNSEQTPLSAHLSPLEGKAEAGLDHCLLGSAIRNHKCPCGTGWVPGGQPLNSWFPLFSCHSPSFSFPPSLKKYSHTNSSYFFSYSRKIT